MENTSTCLGKTVSKRTRSKTKHRILATHRQSSKIHRAISNRNRLYVNILLQKGEKLCADVGINCFILAQSVCSWDFVRFLLAFDLKGLTAKNFDGVTLLMLYAHAHDLKVVDELLKLGANPNDTANDNRTALIMAVTKTYRGRVYFDCSSRHFRRFKEHKDIIDVLVAAGADASVCTTTGENVLHFACKNYYTFTTEVFDTLIKAGANPVALDNEQCTVLSHALRTFCDICASLHFETAKSVCLPALQFLFELPQFNSETLQFNCPSSKHPQSILFQHLFLCQSVMENSFKMTDLIANKLFPKNTELVVNIPMIINENQTHELVTPNQYQLPFGPLALVLNFKRELFLREKSLIDPQEILTTLMSYGYSLSLQFTETISPLTLVLLDPIMFPHYCIGDYLHITKYLIEHGVHVEQRMVPFDDSNDLDELSRNMFLPDALRVAVTYRKIIHTITVLKFTNITL
jgi:ankyrin repeat protein